MITYLECHYGLADFHPNNTTCCANKAENAITSYDLILNEISNIVITRLSVISLSQGKEIADGSWHRGSKW